jgi:hypothetical protein
MSGSNAIETQGTVLAINTGTTASPIWTAIREVVSFSGFDGSAAEIDVTSLESTAKEIRMGLQDFGSFTVECNYLPADTGQSAARAAKASRALKMFRLTFSNSSTASFSAFVMSSGINGGVDAKVDTSFTLRISGSVTFAAS